MVNSSKNILFISPSLPPIHCGIGDYTYSLIKNLSKNKSYNLAVVTDVKAETNQLISNVKTYPEMNRWKWDDLKLLNKICKEFKPDIIHIQHAPGTYKNGFIPYCLPAIYLFKKIKFINTLHEGYTLKNIYKLFILTLFSKKFISVRPNFKKNIHFLFRLFYSSKQFKFIPNSSPFEDYKFIKLDNSEKKTYLQNQERLIVYFGFLFPHKGVDLIFEIADPLKDKILIVGPYDHNDKYHRSISKMANSSKWEGKVDILGFLEKKEVAKILTFADSIILPIRSGSGIWNSSLHTAKLFGSFVLTTSDEKNGYFHEENTYYSTPNNINEMSKALNKFSGRKKQNINDFNNRWGPIINEHITEYETILSMG